MLENTKVDNTQLRLQEVKKALESGMFVLARSILDKMPACDVAFLLESSPPAYRKVLWNLNDHDQHGEILEELNEDAKDEIVLQYTGCFTVCSNIEFQSPPNNCGTSNMDR